VDGWVEEAGLSRLYAGIHYRFDITAGANLGRAVAQWAIANADRLE
jgi:membrane-associated phospholipid phosphatase